MTKALIIGITGQDGQYMAELLLSKGYAVIGTSRNLSKAAAGMSHLRDRVTLVEWDMKDAQRWETCLAETQPDEIYNFGAYSSGAGMFEAPVDMVHINGTAIAIILEGIRRAVPSARFCQAGSSEMFGDAVETPQSENTPFSPRSPYGAAKVMAYWMTRIYRQRYGMRCGTAILFNHESPRRGINFVSRRITRGAAAVKLGMQDSLMLGDLGAQRDWGFAGDYVRAMWMMLGADVVGDYVIATGRTHAVKDMCEIAFSHLGLDYREHVRQDEQAIRQREGMQLVGDPRKANTEMGWTPSLEFADMIRIMVENDLAELKLTN